MYKKLKIISLLVSITLLTFVGCSKSDAVEDFVNDYSNMLNNCEYEKIYEHLSQESKQYISKDEFLKRYNNIYTSIGINNIKIELGDIKNISQIPMSVSMNTIAGDLKFNDTQLKLTKEDNKYKILWDESLILPPMVKEDKVKYEISKASRGKILDRDNNVLAHDSQVNMTNIHPKLFEENKEDNINKMAQILDISEEVIVNELDKNTNLDYLVPIVKIPNSETEKIEELKEIAGVKITQISSRVYEKGEALGNLIGYVGNVTKEDLEKNKGKNYNSYSTIGKKGIENIYEQELRAIDEIHIYIQRGEEKITIAKTQPKNGKDIKLAIDTNLQEDIYKQMNGEKGASIALHPKTGEVLAMVSSPSYDSNTMVTYKTKTLANKFKESNNAEFENRANDLYSPGSTMKLITAAIGLENNVIDPNETMNIKGLNWQKDSSWGKYNVTRVKDSKKPVNLYDAVKYSDNIYFANKALEIGKEEYIKGCLNFSIGEKVPFEYPMQTSQISNDNKLDNDILLADTAYGQGQVLMTPLDVAMCYSTLGNDGNIMIPRLVINENEKGSLYKKAINSKYIPELVKSFSAVINDKDGSGNLAKIDGINLAGKTGTAEIKKSKEDKDGKENGWFVAVNTDNPRLVVSMIIEDVKEKNGSTYVVPKIKNVMQNYLNK